MACSALADGIVDDEEFGGRLASNTSATVVLESLAFRAAGWSSVVCKYGEVLRSAVRLPCSDFGSMTDAELAETGVVLRLRERRSRACPFKLPFAFVFDGPAIPASRPSKAA